MIKRRQSHPISVHDVAAYIQANHSMNKPILAWKMHKLLYFCQMQQMINEGVPMFYEKIMATHKGVVIKELCPFHRDQWYIGNGTKGNLNHLSLKQSDAIGEVMIKFGDKTTEELDELIKLATPWKKVRELLKDNKEVVLEVNLEDFS